MQYWALSVAAFSQWLLSTSVMASVLAVLIFLARMWLKDRAGIRWQYAMWFVLILRLVLPVTPSSSFSVYNILSLRGTAFIHSDLGLQKVDRSTPGFQGTSTYTSGWNGAIGSYANSTEGADPIGFSPLSFANILFLVWLVGTITLVGYVFYLHRKFTRQIRNQSGCLDENILELFAECKQKIAVDKGIDLIETPVVKGPVLAGFIRPKLLLPGQFSQTLSREQLRHIFLHELAHAKRRDILINWCTGLLQAIYWFNPIIWYAFYKMRVDQEIACDDLALACLDPSESKAYAGTIIRLIEVYSSQHRTPGLANLSSRNSEIKRRVKMAKMFGKKSGRWSVVGLVIILTLGVIFLTGAKGNDPGGIEPANTSPGTDIQRQGINKTEGIQIEDIKGNSWKGKVMLIKDPSRVIVASITKETTLGESGQRVTELVKNFNAVAGVNAGGFTDPNGKGNGGFPQGFTISQSKVVYNEGGDKPQDIVGLDNNGKLIVGSMTLSQMQAKGVRDAISFFPALVVNGKGVVKGDGGWGVGPRTAIGQKADGTILLVVIDGRQAQSLGITLRDLQQVFLDYGAVTAANLDGGSSTTMVYNGQVINKPADMFGQRYVPTAFVVKP